MSAYFESFNASADVARAAHLAEQLDPASPRSRASPDGSVVERTRNGRVDAVVVSDRHARPA